MDASSFQSLSDLSPHDKSKIAKLLLAIAELDSNSKQQQAQHEATLQRYQAQNAAIVAEMGTLRSRWRESLQLLKAYKHRVKMLEATVASSSSSSSSRSQPLAGPPRAGHGHGGDAAANVLPSGGVEKETPRQGRFQGQAETANKMQKSVLPHNASSTHETGAAVEERLKSQPLQDHERDELVRLRARNAVLEARLEDRERIISQLREEVKACRARLDGGDVEMGARSADVAQLDGFRRARELSKRLDVLLREGEGEEEEQEEVVGVSPPRRRALQSPKGSVERPLGRKLVERMELHSEARRAVMDSSESEHTPARVRMLSSSEDEVVSLHRQLQSLGRRSGRSSPAKKRSKKKKQRQVVKSKQKKKKLTRTPKKKKTKTKTKSSRARLADVYDASLLDTIDHVLEREWSD